MSDSKRYDIDQTCDFCSMSEDANGSYVDFEDYAALRAKLQAAEETGAKATKMMVAAVADMFTVQEERDAAISRAEAAEAEVDNLAALVRILVHSLRKVNPNSSNIIRAMDYLKRKGLTGSILRDDEPQPQEIPESGGHIESAECWCGPTVEEHPGGTLIIHNQTH